MAEELKACPFCGSTDKPSVGYTTLGSAHVVCLGGCRAGGPLRPAKAQAIAAWNRRTPSPVDEAVREVVEAADRAFCEREDPRFSGAFVSQGCRDLAVAVKRWRAAKLEAAEKEGR